jgi:hypothetical protein
LLTTLERHAAPRAHGFEHLELAVGQAAGLMQKAADQRRLAVIDVTDDDDAHLRAGSSVWRGRQCGGNGHVHGDHK